VLYRQNTNTTDMTYKELLQSLADQASQNYSAYLQSKIDAVISPEDTLLADKTEQYRDGYDWNEKKFGAILAMVKNDQSLEDAAPEDVVKDTQK